MEPIPVNIDSSSIVVDNEKIMALPDMSSSAGDPFTRNVLDRLSAQCMDCFEPRAVFLPMKVPVEGFSMGKVVNRMLKDSDLFAFFISTAGPGPENLAREYLEKASFLEGYLCDLIASRLADSVAEQTHGAIKEYASEMGLKATNRYSPGYCNWDVAEQHNLFQLFGLHTVGVGLSESALMTPVKSVSGIIGLGRNVVFREYSCAPCPKKDCPYRNTQSARP